jgi:hypothetical protein
VSRQAQDVEAGGLAIQSGQNTSVVIHGGVSPDQMSDIMIAIARTVATFTDAAFDKAKREMDAFREEVLNRFAQPGQANPEAFRDPDFQYMLNDAQKAVARSGDPTVRETLVDLIARRSLETSRTRLAINLAEAVTKVANLTPDEFAALSLCYLVRYTIDHGVGDLKQLGNHIQQQFVPFAKNVSHEQASFWHLQAQSCANIGSVSSFDLLTALKRNYGGVLSEGFTRDELQNHLPEGKRNALDQWIIPCLNDNTKLQFRFLNVDAFKKEAAQSGLTEDELQNAWNLFDSRAHNARERINSVAPDAHVVFEAWQSTLLHRTSLTSVGIAIGHANATRIVGLNAPLSIWIK